MPVAVNTSIQGLDAMTSAIIKLQTFLGRTVSLTIDHQSLGSKIIELQNYLQTQGKFSAGSIDRYIDDQALSGKIIDLQNAANLP